MPRPTFDSIYLANRINERWSCKDLTPAGLQAFVNSYGPDVVEDALRELHGFPPSEAVRSPHAYLESMLSEHLVVPRADQGLLW